MVRFDKAITFLPILKSNLLLSVNTKICGLGVLLFWIHKYSIHFYMFMNLIMLLYTFLVTCLDWYKEYTICLISFNKLSELLPVLLAQELLVIFEAFI